MENKKNRIILFFLVSLLFVFVACNSSAKEMENKGQIYTPKIDKEEESAPIEELPAASVEQNTASPVSITSEQFIKLVSDYRKEWKFKGSKPCVVDFYADWCRPCKMMEPAFAKMAEKYAGKVDFYKINVDYNKDISSAYQITGIPTLFFCSRDGKLTRIAGYLTEEQIAANVEMIISK